MCTCTTIPVSKVTLGDDANTTAAIYGQLAGAYYGYSNLPKKWVKQIYARNFITCLSKWIVHEGQIWAQKYKSTSATNSDSPSQHDPSTSNTPISSRKRDEHVNFPEEEKPKKPRK